MPSSQRYVANQLVLIYSDHYDRSEQSGQAFTLLNRHLFGFGARIQCKLKFIESLIDLKLEFSYICISILNKYRIALNRDAK